MNKSWKDFEKSASANAAAIVDSKALKGDCSLVRSKGGMDKRAGMISPDGRHFVLEKGKAPWHVAKEIKRLNPSVKYDLKKLTDMILKANPEAKNGKFLAGTAYKVPGTVTPKYAPTTQAPTGGMRMYPGFVDLLKLIESYGITNSTGTVNNERLKAAILSYKNRPGDGNAMLAANGTTRAGGL